MNEHPSMADRTNYQPLLRRIAVLSVHTSPLARLGGDKTGGMNVYVRDFSCELARQGVQVDIFTRATSGDAPLIDDQLGAGVRVINITAGPRHALPLAEVGAHLAEFADAVYHFASVEGAAYDLIHSHYWLSGLVAEQLRQRWGSLPIVHMFHTLGYQKNKVAQSEQERAPIERMEGERRVVQIADRLIAATQSEHTHLIEDYGADRQKIAVVPPGVDLTRFRTIDKNNARTSVDLADGRAHVIFTGRIEPLKGIDTLLRATALLRQRRPDMVEKTNVTIIGGDLAMIGRDPELTRLYDLRCMLKLCDVVRFVGAKDQTILPYYFAAADIVVMPSHYESFGLVALEAMATGTPVIASAVGGLTHLVQDGETGLVVPPRDPEALAKRMDELLSDTDMRSRLSRQASTHARQYEWSTIVRRMVGEVYQPLLEQRVPVFRNQ
jgi:D-inositol-3-phosphate glycosyltransferase